MRGAEEKGTGSAFAGGGEAQHLRDCPLDRLGVIMKGCEQLEHLWQPSGHVVRSELHERNQRKHPGVALCVRPPLLGALPRPFQRKCTLGVPVQTNESAENCRAHLAHLVLMIAYQTVERRSQCGCVGAAWLDKLRAVCEDGHEGEESAAKTPGAAEGKRADCADEICESVGSLHGEVGHEGGACLGRVGEVGRLAGGSSAHHRWQELCSIVGNAKGASLHARVCDTAEESLTCRASTCFLRIVVRLEDELHCPCLQGTAAGGSRWEGRRRWKLWRVARGSEMEDERLYLGANGSAD